MKDKNKPKKQLIDEPEEMRQRVAQFEEPATKGKRAKGDKKHIHDLAFLSRTATGFLKLSPEDNIYEFIAEQLKELTDNSIIIVTSFDKATDNVCCRAALGIGEKMGAVVGILKKYPVGMLLKIDDEARLGLSNSKLVKVPGGFYEFCFRRIPRIVCRAIEKLLNVGDIYAMGLAWKGNLFGSACIVTRKGTQLADKTVIETFIYQASVALQRWQAEQALQEAHDQLEIRVEERTRELAEANEKLRIEIVERKRMDDQLIVTDRLASIGELASGIAHQLNNPLTSVIGFSDLLLVTDVSDDIKEDLKVINREAKRTAEVVKNLLTFARKHKSEKKPVDVNDIIQTVLALRAYEQQVYNIQVNTQFASDLPEITANAFQLQQVFLNIIINAEHFMTEAHGRGTLTITTEQVGDIIRASFADDGPGITKENLGHLFDPFFTTKEVGKGTGLGLSICHGIITAHGGRIYAESEVGKGAAFVVELPLATSDNGEEIK